jgi:hypothetical protein
VFCGKDGETPGLLNCCVTGTIDCTGTCRTTGTYTQNDGACAGQCNLAYVRQFNQCGELMSATYSTYTNTGCTTPNYTTNDGECTGACARAYVQLRDACGNVLEPQYAIYEIWDCWLGCGPPRDPNCFSSTWYKMLPDSGCEHACMLECLYNALSGATSYNYVAKPNYGGSSECRCDCYSCK